MIHELTAQVVRRRLCTVEVFFGRGSVLRSSWDVIGAVIAFCLGFAR